MIQRAITTYYVKVALQCVVINILEMWLKGQFTSMIRKPKNFKSRNV